MQIAFVVDLRLDRAEDDGFPNWDRSLAIGLEKEWRWCESFICYV